jgi:hypothetical protein
MTTLHGLEIKVGDKVWDTRYGWSEVISLYNRKMYEIRTNYNFYTTEGKYNSSDKLPSIFWNEFEIPKEAFSKPLPNLEVNTKVIVWEDEDGIKERRYFSHFTNDGNICCFNFGATEWSIESHQTSSWKNWELYKEN